MTSLAGVSPFHSHHLVEDVRDDYGTARVAPSTVVVTNSALGRARTSLVSKALKNERTGAVLIRWIEKPHQLLHVNRVRLKPTSISNSQ